MKTDFNEGWEFRRRPDSDFEPVTLPHDAMFGEERRANAPSDTHMAFFMGGTYVYRKKFQAPPAGEYECLSLLFHGISHRSRILINGHEAGGRTNGFVAFEVPIEQFVKPGEQNSIEVIADASQMPLARYYVGAGLYRHVELVKRSKVSLLYDGVRLNTSSVTDGTANVVVEVHLRNPESQKANVSLALSHNGKKIVLWESTTTSTNTGGVLQIPNARLWLAENPSLYDYTVTINRDELKFRAGFRTMELSTKGLPAHQRRRDPPSWCLHSSRARSNWCSAIQRRREASPVDHETKWLQCSPHLPQSGFEGPPRGMRRGRYVRYG